MTDAARAFSDEVRRQGRPWMAVWSATAGGVGTSREVLQHETDALRTLLGSVAAALPSPGRCSSVARPAESTARPSSSP